jgi:hypothetical protein
MKKGQTMPFSAREKMSRTKQRRKKRERIGNKVVLLLAKGKDKEAKILAKENMELFIIE